MLRHYYKCLQFDKISKCGEYTVGEVVSVNFKPSQFYNGAEVRGELPRQRIVSHQSANLRQEHIVTKKILIVYLEKLVDTSSSPQKVMRLELHI